MLELKVYSDIEYLINSLSWNEDDKKYLIEEIGNLPNFTPSMKSSYE